jgi:hypothetical protein
MGQAMPDEMHPDLAALLQRLQAIEERQIRLEAKLQDRQAETKMLQRVFPISWVTTPKLFLSLCQTRLKVRV